MIISSLHNHSTCCDGRSSVDEMIAAAQAAGITDFGISYHSDATYFRDTAVDVNTYVERMRLAQSSANGINVYVGVEEDYFFPVDRTKFDYTIGSVHYAKGERLYSLDGNGGEFSAAIDEVYGGDAFKLAEDYYANVLAQAKSRPDILGHYDLIRKCGGAFIDFNSDRYRKLALDCMDEIIKTGVVVEVNYGAVSRGILTEPYPTDAVLTHIKQKGGRVTLSVDCHDASKVFFGFEEGEARLKELGFTTVTVFTNGRCEDRKL